MLFLDTPGLIFELKTAECVSLYFSYVFLSFIYKAQHNQKPMVSSI